MPRVEMPPRRKRRLLAAAAVLLALAGTLTWRWWSRSPEGVLLASGTIEATEVDVNTRVAGRILERPVDEGDRLEPGMLVARLESAELQAEVDRLRAALAATRTRLPQLRTEIDLKDRLARARIDQARADLAAREARLADLRSGARRQEQQMAAAQAREPSVREAATFGALLHVVVPEAAARAPVVLAALEGAGPRVSRIEPIVPSLEDVFVSPIAAEEDRKEAR